MLWPLISVIHLDKCCILQPIHLLRESKRVLSYITVKTELCLGDFSEVDKFMDHAWPDETDTFFHSIMHLFLSVEAGNQQVGWNDWNLHKIQSCIECDR